MAALYRGHDPDTTGRQVNPGAVRQWTAGNLEADSSADCSGGEICCYRQMYIDSRTACIEASSCVDPLGPVGGYSRIHRRVCDPAKVAPSKCLSGICKPAPDLSQHLPSYRNLCF
jgi:hypothetical protein